MARNPSRPSPSARDASVVRPLPDFLPGTNSRSWHASRQWDPLGHARFHRLAQPPSSADAQELVRRLNARRPRTEPRRSHIDIAASAARSYQRVTRRASETDDEFAARRDRAWDAVLDALDAYLLLAQIDHLERAADGGASGPEVHAKVDRLRP